jgi:hypothetical protein
MRSHPMLLLTLLIPVTVGTRCPKVRGTETALLQAGGAYRAHHIQGNEGAPRVIPGPGVAYEYTGGERRARRRMLMAGRLSVS